MTNALSIRRRLVGSSLRQYRESLGYDLAVPARILECDRSKISRIETGQRGIRPKELRELLTEYGVDAAARDALTVIARRPGDPRQCGHEHVLGSAYFEFLEIEQTASAVFTYAPVQIPRLLQTPEYARAIITADPTTPEQAMAALAAVELARQQATLDRCRTIGLTAVIGEAALRHHIGSREIMRAQLRHLAEISANCPQVSIRILPFTAGDHASSGAGFSILKFSQLPLLGLVHIDGPAGGTWIDTPAGVTAYTTTFSHMQLYTLTRQESAAMLSEQSRMGEV